MRAVVVRTLWLPVLLGACGGSPSTDRPPVRIVIPSGAGLRQVTDSLVARGVVTHPRWFRFLARASGIDRSLKAGTYDLPTGVSARAILRTLHDGRGVLSRLTVPEGLMLATAVQVIADRAGVPADSVLAAARDTSLLRRWRIPGTTAEGFLYPETYLYTAGATARDLVGLMLAGYRDTWTPSWSARADSLGLTERDVVTLASIVEGEARVEEERGIISAVYHNRLRLGMPLQADPTVQYAIALRTGDRKTRLLEKDYEVVSPYNTYLHPGLPPGPVNSPGRSSLEAALYPADAPFLYFVAQPDGRHVFSRTYAEHLRAIARIRREERTAPR